MSPDNPIAIPAVLNLELNSDNTYSFNPVLRAFISAAPPPAENEITWYQNGVLITPDHEVFEIDSDPPSELELPDEIDASIGGEYTCVVNTSAGVAVANFTVSIQSKLNKHL